MSGHVSERVRREMVLNNESRSCAHHVICCYFLLTRHNYYYNYNENNIMHMLMNYKSTTFEKQVTTRQSSPRVNKGKL